MRRVVLFAMDVIHSLFDAGVLEAMQRAFEREQPQSIAGHGLSPQAREITRRFFERFLPRFNVIGVAAADLAGRDAARMAVVLWDLLRPDMSQERRQAVANIAALSASGPDWAAWRSLWDERVLRAALLAEQTTPVAAPFVERLSVIGTLGWEMLLEGSPLTGWRPYQLASLIIQACSGRQESLDQSAVQRRWRALGLVESIRLQPLHAAMQVFLAHARSRHPELRDLADASGEITAEILWAATSERPVLILGPPGTGKEVVARAVHALSPRANKAYVPRNLGLLTETAAQSELFGHVKGAFTGADKNRDGAFVKAHHGTLFLDEIGDAKPEVQVALLRALQEKEISPLGSDAPQKVDVRIIAATNRDLNARVAEGLFRDDLLTRLRPYDAIRLRPLNARSPSDKYALWRHLVARALKEVRADATGYVPLAPDEVESDISPRMEALMRSAIAQSRREQIKETTRELEARDWSGNVREMEALAHQFAMRCRHRSEPLSSADFLASASREQSRAWPSDAAVMEAFAQLETDIKEEIEIRREIQRLTALDDHLPDEVGVEIPALPEGSRIDRLMSAFERALLGEARRRKGSDAEASEYLGLKLDAFRKRLVRQRASSRQAQ